MIIVCTQDASVRTNSSGAAAWGNRNLLNPGGQPAATVQLARFVASVGPHEALCLSAHGNNAEIGDEGTSGWLWTTQNVAEILQRNLPAGYDGQILISACATSVVNFSASLAQALRTNRWRSGLWIFGYNTSLSTNATYPNPARLTDNVSLQGTRV